MQCYNCGSPRLEYEKETDSYVCLDCGHRYPKEYWFISHSHLDIEKVRVVRNVIEEIFFYEPILFFLKCLSEDSEVQDLIRREIYERIWFVYCQSPNAEKSKYVQDERKYLDELMASGMNKHKIEINLDAFDLWDPRCKEDIRRQVFSKIRKDKVFISCSAHDSEYADQLFDYLQVRGYRVYLDKKEAAFGAFAAQVQSAIRYYGMNDGVVLALVSRRSLKSSFVQAELKYALTEGAMVVPVIVAEEEGVEVELYRELIALHPQLAKCHYLTLHRGKLEEMGKKLVRMLEHFYYFEKK